jgi:hypothetical protein
VSVRRLYRPLVALLVAGIALREVATAGFWPAYIANPDAYSYLDAAGGELFKYAERPSGYPLFLRVADFGLFGEFPLLIALQHLLGLAAGVLLYLATWRFGAPRPVALIPAGVILLTGDQIFFEHAVLSEALFGFLIAAAVYCASRTIDSRALPWAAAAGALLAAAATVRTVGLFMLPLLVLWVAFTQRGRIRARAAPALACVAAGVLVAGAYVVAQRAETGFTGFARTSGWSLYSRVAPFADCSQFTPPEGTSGLCQPEVPSDARPGATFYHHNSASPAWQVFGPPPAGNDKLRAFAREVIVSQPYAYARTVVKDTLRYIDRDIGLNRPYDGTGPGGLSFNEPNPDYLAPSLDEIRTHWGAVNFHDRFGGTLRTYQDVIRVHGYLLPVLVLLGLLGLWPARRSERAGIALMGGMAAIAVVVPSATLFYSWRYLVPLLPLLVAAAALGGLALARYAGERRATRGGHTGSG